MAQGKKTGGRKAGTPNKMTQAVKDVIAGAAAELGGQDRLVAWAKSDPANERAFWATIYPKLLPLQLTGEGGGALRAVTEIHLVPFDDQHRDSST